MGSVSTATVEVDYDGNGTYETDISAFVESAEIEYGRQSPLDAIDAGTMTIVLDNSENDFTPGHSEATYGTGQLIGRSIRCRASVTGESGTPILFEGSIEDPDVEAEGFNDSTVIYKCTDDTPKASRRYVTGTFSEAFAGDFANAVLTAVGWGTGPGDRSINVGHSIFGTTTFDEENLIDILALIAESEDGRFFFQHGADDYANTLTFHQRNRPVDVSGVILSDDANAWGALTAPYADFSIGYGSELLVNSYATANRFGDEVTGSDSVSTGKYEPRTWRRTGLLTKDANHTHRAGDYKTVKFAEPDLRIRSVVTDIWAAEPVGALALLRFHVGTGFNFVWRPPGATVDVNQALEVEGVRFEITPNEDDTGHLITGEFNAIPQDTRTYFALDGSALDGSHGLAP